MKINFKLPGIVLGLLLLLAGTNVQAQDNNVSLQQFYDELSPYGTWIQDPQYGYVWRPDVDQADFRPYYTNGRWAMTDYGNTWVSNYEWGWAPFHYGRWVADAYNRWLWIPGTTWGPAWVDWRSGGGYYGWAPMAPLISININFGRRYVRPDYCWSFIPQSQIYYSSYPRYRSYNNVRIIYKTKIINNTYVNNHNTYNTGPRPEEIRRATNQDVKVYQLARNTRVEAQGINNNTLNVYTPRPSRASQANPAPREAIASNVDRSSRTADRSVRMSDNAVNNRSNTAPAGRVADRGSESRSSESRSSMPEVRSREQESRSSSPVRSEQPAEQGRSESRPQYTPPVRQERSEQAPVQRSAPTRTERAPVMQQQPQQQNRQMQAPPSQSQNRSGNSGSRSSGGSERQGSSGRPTRGGGH